MKIDKTGVDVPEPFFTDPVDGYSYQLHKIDN